MTYAQVTDNTITTIQGRLPKAARRLDDGNWVLGLADATPDLVEACGWHEVVDTVRPDDTDTTAHDRSIELVDGTPTVVWAERVKTADEVARDREAAAPDLTTAVAARLVAQDNANPQEWVQPTGAHDAYLPGALVLFNAVEYRNALDVPNVWAPDVHGWESTAQPPSGPQPWAQPTGAHDAYSTGDRVTHDGQTWESTVGANVWEPGVAGWTAVT